MGNGRDDIKKVGANDYKKTMFWKFYNSSGEWQYNSWKKYEKDQSDFRKLVWRCSFVEKKGKGEQSGEIVCYFEKFDGDSTPAWANTWTCSRKRAVLLPRPSQMGMSVKLRIRGRIFVQSTFWENRSDQCESYRSVEHSPVHEKSISSCVNSKQSLWG